MRKKVFEVLQKLEKQSLKEKTRKVNVSRDKRMLAITKETGEFFNLILRTKNAKKVLEIGTSVGYSTLWLAEALTGNSSKIITIDSNPEKIQRAKINFKEAKIDSKIEIKQGKALEILKKMQKLKRFENFFDFVLIDADKENVLNYFKTILPMTKIGGIIATDNMLSPKKYEARMNLFSKEIRKEKRVRTVLIPIGNGEEMTIKIRN